MLVVVMQVNTDTEGKLMNTSPKVTVHQRDVTRVLNLVQYVLRHNAISGDTETRLTEAEKILVRMDARTGRRDPSKRVRRTR
jgi:hypothetical protein